MTWLIHMGHDSLICLVCNGSRHISVRDSWHDSFIWDVTRSCAIIVGTLAFVTPREGGGGLLHPYGLWLTHMKRNLIMWQVCNGSRDTSSVRDSWLESLIRDVTHSYVPWLIHMGRDTIMLQVCNGSRYTSSVRDSWLESLIRDVTRSYVPWLIHMGRDTIMLQVCNGSRHTSSVRDPWLESLICDVTHSYVPWLTRIGRDSIMWQVCNDSRHTRVRDFTRGGGAFVAFSCVWGLCCCW